MWEFLRKINQEQAITIILTTHYLEEAEMLCRNIGIINRGDLIENTSMKSLLNQLHVETFILDLDKADDLPKLAGVTSQKLVNGSLEIEIEKTVGLNQVFQQLTDLGVQVLSMRNKANRLEELFVDIVKQKGEEA